MPKSYVDPEKCRTVYPGVLVKIREVAAGLGYAVGVHGSETRDLDLIAVPWVEDAAPAVALAEAIQGAIGGFRLPHEDDKYFRAGQPDAKSHGRLVWSFHLGGGPYVDLSIVPRRPRSDTMSKLVA